MSELDEVRTRMTEVIRRVDATGSSLATGFDADALDYLSIRLAVLDNGDDLPWPAGTQVETVRRDLDRARRLAHALWHIKRRPWWIALGKSLAGAALAHASREITMAVA